MLPAVEDLIGALAYLWHPSVSERMRPKWQLAFVPAELLVLADPTRRSVAVDCGHPLVTELSGWLRQAREASYELVSQLVQTGNSLGYVTYLQAHPASVVAIFGSMDYMENRHLWLLVRSGLLPLLQPT